MHNLKQFIVMRKDLKMRRGKEIAQGSHASMAFLAERMESSKLAEDWTAYSIGVEEEHAPWLLDHFTKVCLQVDSEAELVSIYDAAKAAGLEVHMIEDEGATEFHGVLTKTCLAIGPVDAEKARPVTGHLKLY